LNIEYGLDSLSNVKHKPLSSILLPSYPLSCPLASSEERGEEARGQDRQEGGSDFSKLNEIRNKIRIRKLRYHYTKL
jgi:hypothetical protein